MDVHGRNPVRSVPPVQSAAWAHVPTAYALRTGTVSDGFYWRDSDDGSMNEPKTGYVPVIWDNGTQGYHHESELEYA